MTEWRRMDAGSAATLVVTLVLFVAALFSKGITHDLFLEGGVLLVSLKVVMAIQRIREGDEKIERRLDRIETLLTKREECEHLSEGRGPEVDEPRTSSHRVTADTSTRNKGGKTA